MKITRTNERCYICDFARDTDTLEDVDFDSDLKGLYRDGLLPEKVSGRHVFVDPKTGKPICNHCFGAAKATLKWLESATPNIPIGVPPDLVEHHNNINWDKLERWPNGNIRFLLPKKHKGLTDEERAQVEAILERKQANR